MARSLRNGDYDLVLALQSPSDPERWYRVLADRHAPTLTLSCDCPVWRFNQRGDRTCKHTEIAQEMLGFQSNELRRMPSVAADHPFVSATRNQWGPLREFIAERGWNMQECRVTNSSDQYRMVILRAQNPSGLSANGMVAFANRHQLTTAERAAMVAGWCGYSIASTFTRAAGIAMPGEPPRHWSGQAHQRGAGISNRELLRIGNQQDLGDGLSPQQRAENTLRLFLGVEQASLLDRTGYLDVSSSVFEGRVYRLRRDPDRFYERRIRVFEHGAYVRDLCVVRGQNVPEADHFLTVYFGLIANERWVLSVVGPGNVFAPHSDGYIEEPVVPIWRPRFPSAAAA